VLAGFEQWLGDGPEREALRLLGFFDRPADVGCLNSLRIGPGISGVNDHLVDLDDARWDRVLTRLEKLRLVYTQRDSSGEPLAVDAHPLIREHFARSVRDSKLEGWRVGHRRLYEHLCTTTKEGEQPTIEDLQPLFQAVSHGCDAGMQQRALNQIYVARILRGNEHYSWKILGSLGSDLEAVAQFFDHPWNQVSRFLDDDSQGLVMNQAAMYLRGLGRLTEARNPMWAATELAARKHHWVHAAVSASNLSELELALGDVVGAVRDGEQSVAYADRSGDLFQRMSTRSIYAEALRQGGHRDKARTRFRDAEDLQKGKLFSVRGFRYCELLLTESEQQAWRLFLEHGRKEYIRDRDQAAVKTCIEACRAASDRAMQTLAIADTHGWRLDIGLNHLTLGRAALYNFLLASRDDRAQLVQPSSPSPAGQSSKLEVELKSVAARLDTAVDGIRRAGRTDYLPQGLITRAWCSIVKATNHGLLDQTEQLAQCQSGAQSDLNEAWEIAERGPMPLFLADVHLHRARLLENVTPYPWATDSDGHPCGPHDDLAEARRLIEKHGYWRRKEELEDAEAAALNWPRQTT
jgi:hypothetical protein